VGRVYVGCLGTQLHPHGIRQQVNIPQVTQGALQGHTDVQLELTLTQLYSVCPPLFYALSAKLPAPGEG
jgi:hypothetical protein